MAFPDSLPDLPASRAKNRRPYGAEYPVSKVEGNFLTIQKAIDAAIADGHGPTDPALVVVYPGSYTENLTLTSGIDIRSASPFSGRFDPDSFASLGHVVINGTVSYATATVAGFELEQVVLDGLHILGPALAVSSAILFSGANFQALVLTNMRVTGTASLAPAAINHALEMTNTALGSGVFAENCTLELRGATISETAVSVVEVDAGRFVAIDTRVFNQLRSLSSGYSVLLSGTSSIAQILEGSSLCGGFRKSFGNTETSVIRNATIDTIGTGPAPVDAGNGGQLFLIDLEIDEAGGTPGVGIPAITGALSITPPVILWSNLTFVNDGVGFLAGVNHVQLPKAESNRLVQGVATVSTAARPNELIQMDMTTAAAPVTVTLPPVGETAGGVAAGAIALRGVEIEVKEVSGTAGSPLAFPLTVAASGGDLIDGAASAFAFQTHWQSARFTVNEDGTGWLVSGEYRKDGATYIEVDTVDATPSSTVLYDLPADRDAVYLRGVVTARSTAADDKVLQTLFEGTFIRTDSAGAYPANISIIGLTNTLSLAIGFTFTTALIGTTGGAANEITMTLTGEAGTAIAWTICIEEARALR